MRDLQKAVAARAELISRMVGPGSNDNFVPFDALVVRAAVECGGLKITGLPDLEARCCFRNAWRDLTEAGEDWRYCEGYAASPDLMLPIHHAWLVNVHTLAVRDRTPAWAKPRGAIYWGIPFQTEYVLKSSMESGWPSPLFNGDIYRPEIASLPFSMWHGMMDKLNREGGASVHKLNREGVVENGEQSKEPERGLEP
jgi:hypothetical protein